MLYRVVANNFVAGYRTEDGIVVDCAPILRRWIMGRSWREALKILRRHRVEFLT